MSSENDVPLGEGSQQHYEEMFGERIRRINKEGGARQPDNGGSSGNGRLGCGVLIAIFLLIRAFSALLNSHLHTSTPVQPRFEFQQPILIDPPVIEMRDEDEKRFLDQFREGEADEEKPRRLPPGGSGLGK